MKIFKQIDRSVKLLFYCHFNVTHCQLLRINYQSNCNNVNYLGLMLMSIMDCWNYSGLTHSTDRYFDRDISDVPVRGSLDSAQLTLLFLHNLLNLRARFSLDNYYAQNKYQRRLVRIFYGYAALIVYYLWYQLQRIFHYFFLIPSYNTTFAYLQ